MGAIDEVEKPYKRVSLCLFLIFRQNNALKRNFNRLLSVATGYDVEIVVGGHAELADILGEL